MSLHVKIKWGSYGEYALWWTKGVNLKGYTDIMTSFWHDENRSIKYITFYYIPYNRVGDIVCCKVKKVSERGLLCTGPYESGKIHSALGRRMWRNHSVDSVKITKAKIEFMDGTKKTIPATEMLPFDPIPQNCYIATAVYGSYDCPEVWTLRRYRDAYLAKTWCGKYFISFYYYISPFLVKKLYHIEWIKKISYFCLNKFVKILWARGYSKTPYNDYTRK